MIKNPNEMCETTEQKFENATEIRHTQFSCNNRIMMMKIIIITTMIIICVNLKWTITLRRKKESRANREMKKKVFHLVSLDVVPSSHACIPQQSSNSGIRCIDNLLNIRDNVGPSLARVAYRQYCIHPHHHIINSVIIIIELCASYYFFSFVIWIVV